MVSEVDEPAVQADEPEQDAPEDEETDLAEVLKTEAEALAAELDEAAELGIDAETLQEVEDTVEPSWLRSNETVDMDVQRLWNRMPRATPKSRRATASTVACLVTGLATKNVASRVQSWVESRSTFR